VLSFRSRAALQLEILALYVFLVLAHDRRRIVHIDVMGHPTAAWTVQQLREAFPWDTGPRYLLRDRDSVFGRDFDTNAEQPKQAEISSSGLACGASVAALRCD
jgi:hypothetical protein